MSQWKGDDSAANSVIWAATPFKSNTEVTDVDEQTAFFGNTTANAYVAGITVGQYGVSAAEMMAVREARLARPQHSGWVLKIEGSGNNADRVRYETLVAMRDITGDAEDASFLDYVINILTQPADASANTTDDEVATFDVSAVSVPSGATLGYLWTYANGDAITIGPITSNTSTASMDINANAVSNGVAFKVEISATGAANVVSSNAVLEVTT